MTIITKPRNRCPTDAVAALDEIAEKDRIIAELRSQLAAATALGQHLLDSNKVMAAKIMHYMKEEAAKRA